MHVVQKTYERMCVMMCNSCSVFERSCEVHAFRVYLGLNVETWLFFGFTTFGLFAGSDCSNMIASSPAARWQVLCQARKQRHRQKRLLIYSRTSIPPGTKYIFYFLLRILRTVFS